MKLALAAILAVALSASSAFAGCGIWGCRPVRVAVADNYYVWIQPAPVVVQSAPVMVQPAPVVVPGVVVRKHYATPLRNALFGKYRVIPAIPVAPVCPNGNCQPSVQPVEE